MQVKVSYFDGIMNGGVDLEGTQWVHTQCEQCNFVYLSMSSRACVMLMCVCMLLAVQHVCISVWACAYAKKPKCDITAHLHVSVSSHFVSLPSPTGTQALI